MKFIKYNTFDRIGYITLNRPEKRNALNAELVDELKQTIIQAEQDNIAKVIVIKAEGKAEAEGITKLNKALSGSGGKTMVKLRIAEAMQGKEIILLPLSEGGMNLKTTDINDLIHTVGIKSLSKSTVGTETGKKVLKD